MSGLAAIIDWVQQEIILTRDAEPQDEFVFISEQFEKDGRLPLADILGDEQGEFLEYLENNIPRSKQLSSIDESLEESQSLLDSVKSIISRLFR